MNIVRIGGGFIVAVAMTVVLATGSQVQAAEQKTAPKAEQKSEKKAEKAYSYVAQPGDTYTQLVRKAVQTYGINSSKELGKARIVAIETMAASEAFWPEIVVGQKVSFTGEQIKTWADSAMKLSDTDVAAWGTYVPYIDFDTRSIGE